MSAQREDLAQRNDTAQQRFERFKTVSEISGQADSSLRELLNRIRRQLPDAVAANEEESESSTSD